MDDAGITYSAAFELADHHSLAPSLEGTPVESYSNPLLFFIVAFLRLFGVFDPITTHLRLEMLVFAAMVTLVWSMLRSLTGEVAAMAGAVMFVAIELLTPATWTWYGSGLENVWVSAGLVALLWICARTARGLPLSPAWGNVAFLVAITRPEAPLYVASFYGALFAFARPPSVSIADHGRQVVRALVVTVALYVVFLCWRRIGYGDWLPNTYYAKLHGEPQLTAHLRDYVVGSILPYCRAGLFACSVVALLLVPRMERVATCLLVFLVASLALPITAGADWMGEHRFATPFLAICHLCYATVVAACVAGLTQRKLRSWRPSQVFAVVAVLVVAALLKYDRIAGRDHMDLNDVTIARVAELEGGRRWEQQMRLGLPFPLVQMPDAGGSLLVGATQMLDNGYLADFQMARIGRNYQTEPTDLRVLDQYQHEERRPDLMSENRQFALDRSYLGTRYLPPTEGVFWVRSDVVAVSEIDANTRKLYDDARLRIYLSSATEPTSGPGGLFRCELVVAWSDLAHDTATRIRGHVEGGDRDDIALAPYQRTASGIERFALLLGAPTRAGAFLVSLELVRDGQATPLGTFTLAVTDDEGGLQRAIAEISKAPAPIRVVQRLAWLREQLVPRLGMTAFRDLLAHLGRADRHHSPNAGADILKLRANAQIAALGPVPPALRAAEITAMRGLFATCPAVGAATPVARRVGCLGRTVDQLRRLGYLGVLERVPDIAHELDDARGHLDDWPADLRYQALVGLTLAMPGEVGLQRRLLAERHALAASGGFPAL